MRSIKFDSLDSQIKRVSHVTNLDDYTWPILINDIMPTWNGYGKWTLNYLNEAYGKLPIYADRNVLGQKKYFMFNFSDYIRYMLESTDINPYYAKSTIHLVTEMKDDYVVPDYFECWYRNYYNYIGKERKISLSNIYLGPKYARSNLHIDIWGTSFWNALFCGKKLWVFIPKNQETFIYEGAVDPFFPDFRKFPKYKKVTPHFCVQYPGQLLYCPGNIWHTAMALEPSFALSENFINKGNFKNVISTFEKQGYHNALQKMREIVALNLSTDLNKKKFLHQQAQ